MPINALITAATALLVPRFVSALVLRGPRYQAKLACSLSLQATLTAGIAAAAVIVWSAPVTLVVFGRGYERFHALLAPLALSAMLNVCTTPANSGLRALRAGRQIFLIQLTTSASSLLVLIILLRSFGITGAAWSITIQSAILTCASWTAYLLAIHARMRDSGQVVTSGQSASLHYE
jgi:O-antigen/teichoic acid export membrane protein